MNHLFAEAANITAGGDPAAAVIDAAPHVPGLRLVRTTTLSQFDEMGGMADVVHNEIKRLLSRDEVSAGRNSLC